MRDRSEVDTMVTDEDRAKYSHEYAALELREGQALHHDLFHQFRPNNDTRIGRGNAGDVFRFKVSAGVSPHFFVAVQ